MVEQVCEGVEGGRDRRVAELPGTNGTLIDALRDHQRSHTCVRDRENEAAAVPERRGQPSRPRSVEFPLVCV
jgi:hypothetical protein